MSSYAYIYLHKGNEYMEVECACRSSAMFHVINSYAPYGKIRKMEVRDLHNMVSEEVAYVENLTKDVSSYKERIDHIGKFNNPIEDKLEALRDIEKNITEIEEELNEVQAVIPKLEWLAEIADDEQKHVDVYFGVECGNEEGNVTDADIER